MNDNGISPYSLNGLVAVVTGAAQGLGLEIASQLAHNGATVIIADVQLEKARATADQLRANSLKVQAAYLDITDSIGVTAFFEQAAGEHGRLDILVNNAGVGQNVTPIVELSDQGVGTGIERYIDWYLLLLPCGRRNHGAPGVGKYC